MVLSEIFRVLCIVELVRAKGWKPLLSESAHRRRTLNIFWVHVEENGSNPKAWRKDARKMLSKKVSIGVALNIFMGQCKSRPWSYKTIVKHFWIFVIMLNITYSWGKEKACCSGAKRKGSRKLLSTRTPWKMRLTFSWTNAEVSPGRAKLLLSIFRYSSYRLTLLSDKLKWQQSTTEPRKRDLENC